MGIESELRELANTEKTPEAFLVLADWLEEAGRVKEAEESRETAVTLKAWNEMSAVEIEIVLKLINEGEVYGFDDIDGKYGDSLVTEALTNLIQKGIVHAERYIEIRINWTRRGLSEKSRMGVFQIDAAVGKLILGKGSEHEDRQTNAAYKTLKKKLIYNTLKKKLN